MTVVGYCRVSSASQSLDVQIEQLRTAGCEELFEEKKSGSSTVGRDQLAAALRFVRKGDVFVVTRLDRLARSMIDLKRIVDELNLKGVGLRVVQQGAIDTTKSEGRLLLHMLASFAEFELDIKRERQAEGIAKAKEQGKYRGRPSSIDPEKIIALKAQGMGPSAIAKQLGIARASVYRVAG